MSWDMDTASGVITFYCDTCQESHVVNIADARAGSSRREPYPDLLPCWDYAGGLGWVSFKRTGQSFPLVWDPTIQYVPAVDVTRNYIAPTK